ncbi:hypothetical protein [Crateriforma conspicua]|uniref:hypothetical protein n=1 Tax=Crateriforma conspicua TaxID=2527996 RepID=UPI001E602378|nr:hypothetical protein [Crateriforma conspicua]
MHFLIKLYSGSVTATASRSSFATASRFDDFEAAGGLDHFATAIASVIVLVEQLLEQSQRVAGLVARCGSVAAANRLATADGFANGNFATASGFNNRCAAGVASAVTLEQLAEQTALRCRSFAATNRFANRCTNGLASANRLAHVTTGITSVTTQLVKQAERAGARGTAGGDRESQQSRDDYTTHREFSMER